MGDMNYTQDEINKKIVTGADLSNLPAELIAAAPQSFVNGRIAKGGSPKGLSPQQLSKVDIDSLVSYALTGASLYYFTQEQRAQIPQDKVNICIQKHFDPNAFTKEQLDAVPQSVINLRVATGGDWLSFNSVQVAKIPSELKKPTSEMWDALRAYQRGELSVNRLPLSVFANYETRGKFLQLQEQKAKAYYKQLTQQYRDKNFSIPNDIRKEFDKKMEEFRQKTRNKMVCFCKGQEYKMLYKDKVIADIRQMEM